MLAEPPPLNEPAATAMKVPLGENDRLLTPFGVPLVLNMIGVPAGKPRLPYVELDADEQAVVRTMLERHGMLATAA